MIEIVDCQQGSETWFRARAGIPTASEFSTVLASGKGGGESITRRKYMYRLAGEIITGEPAPQEFTNASLERGKVMEAEARNAYSFMNNVEPQTLGFVRNEQMGCSPDSFVGADGGLEIKTALPHIMIEKLLKGDFPPEHKAQVQGTLLVTEREWWDLCVFWPNMKPFIKRAYRDAPYIAALKDGISAFNDELAEVVEKVRRL